MDGLETSILHGWIRDEMDGFSPTIEYDYTSLYLVPLLLSVHIMSRLHDDKIG